MKKKIVLGSAFLLVFCLAAPLFGGGAQSSSGASSGSGASAGGQVANMNLTGYPIAIQPVNLSVQVVKRPQHNRSVAEYAYFIDLEKKTNVKINWVEWNASDANDKRQLAFATNQLPDVFLAAIGNMANYYGNQGQLMPLNDLIKNYAPDIQAAMQTYPDSYGMMTNPDSGKWYALANMQDPMYVYLSPPDLYINKQWCDNLGLKVPVTVTDFYNVLKEFKAKDANGNGNPNDEIPFAFSYEEGAPAYSFTGLYIMFFPFGVSESNDHLMVVNGKLVHTFTMPAFRDGVRYLANLYKDGLIDPESFTYNRQQLFAACQAKEIGASIGFSISNNYGPKKEPEYTTLFLKGPNGENPLVHKNSVVGGPGSGPSMSATCKIPEIAIRWINEFYKPELTAQQMYGELGKYLIPPAPGSPYMYDFAPVPPGVNPDEFRYSISNGLGAEFYRPKNLVPVPAMDLDKKNNDIIKDSWFEKNPIPNFVFTDAEMNELQPMGTAINTFIMNTLAQWIVKGTVDAEWDQFQQQFIKMGLPRYLEIYQTAYDRMMAAR
ncbi:MAG: extracellular solute-binding protein [Treponema sp.]|nr:extracellular solute-binding protein [Treponema sp.]